MAVGRVFDNFRWLFCFAKEFIVWPEDERERMDDDSDPEHDGDFRGTPLSKRKKVSSKIVFKFQLHEYLFAFQSTSVRESMLNKKK